MNNNVGDLSLDDNLTQDATQRFKSDLNDFFNNEIVSVANDIVEICQKIAGPENYKEELLAIFAIGKGDKKGRLQTELVKCAKKPPQQQKDVDNALSSLAILENEILDLVANLIYDIDEWLDYYRDRSEKNIPIPMMQLRAVNSVIEDFQRLNKYLHDEHEVIFRSLLNIFEQLKGELPPDLKKSKISSHKS